MSDKVRGTANSLYKGRFRCRCTKTPYWRATDTLGQGKQKAYII